MPRPKSEPKVCELCDYRTTIKASYEAHLLTKRHMERVANQGNDQMVYRQCDVCQRKYTSYAGLWRHRQTCVARPRGAVAAASRAETVTTGPTLVAATTVTEPGANTVVFETGAMDTSFQAEVIRHLNELRGLITDLRESRPHGGVVITVTPK